jgi:hypothetical protein
MATNTETHTEKGVSLARGPALILGTVLEVAGLYFLYKQHGFPKFSNFPNGSAPVPGKVFLGIFGANGWTGLFTAAAGGVLLFGAAQHLLAKTMSLIVGVALGAAAVIALISGNVLGLAAANSWTKIGWAACAVILLFNTMVPRRTRTVTEPVAGSAAYEDRPVAAAPVARDRGVSSDRNPTGNRELSTDQEATGDRALSRDRETDGADELSSPQTSTRPNPQV